MASRRIAGTVAALLACALLGLGVARAEPVRVRAAEGRVYGVLVVTSAAGETLAHGELVQTLRQNLVENRLTFHFKDGSQFDETVVYTQQDVFTLVSYRLLQSGPSFPGRTEVSFERASGRYRARVQEKRDEPEETVEGRLDLPPDLYNGMTSVLLKNLRPGESVRGHVLAFTPKPRLLKMEASQEGSESFTVGPVTRKAARYRVSLEVGGLTGVVATILGKDPPDVRYWIAHDPVAAFVKFEGPFFLNGPVWRIEVAAPRWAR